MVERKINTILKIISSSKEPIGSKEISDKLKEFGIDLSERTVRYHMKMLDERGLTEGKWKEGRIITEKGVEELHDSFVSEKMGFVSSRIDSKAYQMSFDLNKMKGNVILNVSFIPKDKFQMAKQTLAQVFDNELSTGQMVLVAQEGEEIGGVVIPEGKIGFGTLCSVNLNGILLKHAIPVDSRFGGVLQVKDNKPLRFTDLISYDGSTLDPLEVFIKSRMTDIRGVIHDGSGKVMAGFREIPDISKEKAEEILRKAREVGLGSPWIIGKPGQPLLGVPVSPERVGLVFLGGLNPIAAVEEVGIKTESRALKALVDFKLLKSFWDII